MVLSKDFGVEKNNRLSVKNFQLIKKTLSNILAIHDQIKESFKKHQIDLLYNLNKMVGGRNQDLNLFFCRKCKVKSQFKNFENFLRLCCCNKMVSVNYKYAVIQKNEENKDKNEFKQL